MADPRELARQAFNMLQSALASSEERAEKLHEELARKPVGKDKLANQVNVLSHRLESVEEERSHWRREAEQLQDVLAQERVKFDALKRKLEIAEAGPDKISKKEINYWRANAEKFDAQINAYKSRIAVLKRELREQEQTLEAAEPGAAPAGTADSGALAATQQEIAGLRQQIAGLNAVIADGHTTRERLESELAALRERLDESERSANETERQDESVAVDVERLRSENSELRASLQMSEAGLHDLRRARDDMAAEHAALKSQVEELRSRGEKQERQAQLLTAQLDEGCSREAVLQSELEQGRARADALHREIENARAREGSRQSELAALRQALAESEQRLPAGAVPGEIADGLKAELDRAQQESAELRDALSRTDAELTELRDARKGLAAELAEAHRRLEADQAGTHEHARTQQALAAELEATREREAALRAELDDSKRVNQGRDEAARALNDAVAAAERKASDAAAVIEELEIELKEEREYSENLSELANSRLDEINKLQDGVEEARERLDDALWRLGKAKYFERIVARRKGLIKSLIETIRSKNKAMVALKAGIDSLRTHKAVVEETQQKLLVRLEALKNELSAAKSKIKTLQAEAAVSTQSESGVCESDVAALNERLATQVELIQSLEEELKTAKAFKRGVEEKDNEVAQLREELETKNTIIARLQADIDEQQRKLAKLRGSESETTRLRALKEQDQSKIDVLERENAELRAMIESAERSPTEAGELSDERETELQAKIAELTEAVDKWKRKYEFLATEAPAAYQTQTAAKQ